MEEAFKRIEIDERGIGAMQFAEALLPLVAVGVVGRNGAGDVIRTRYILLGRNLSESSRCDAFLRFKIYRISVLLTVEAGCRLKHVLLVWAQVI
ncbi:MAG: hypothetical protein O2826_07315 [Chloroflexi bacterium]|nr:hypothetical protein [Chloroflexota bacterium]